MKNALDEAVKKHMDGLTNKQLNQMFFDSPPLGDTWFKGELLDYFVMKAITTSPTWLSGITRHKL